MLGPTPEPSVKVVVSELEKLGLRTDDAEAMPGLPALLAVITDRPCVAFRYAETVALSSQEYAWHAREIYVDGAGTLRLSMTGQK